MNRLIGNIITFLELIWADHKKDVIIVIGVTLAITLPYIPIDGVFISCDGYSITTFTKEVSLLQIITKTAIEEPDCIWTL